MIRLFSKIKKDSAIEKLNKRIDKYYSKHRKTLKIYLRPREIWEIYNSLEITSSYYISFKFLENSHSYTLWYRGALIIRKEL